VDLEMDMRVAPGIEPGRGYGWSRGTVKPHQDSPCSSATGRAEGEFFSDSSGNHAWRDKPGKPGK
jgi:hypothetical protein